MSITSHHIPDHIAIRRIWPTDVPRYCDHLKRLDPESRHARFNGMVSDESIDAFTETAYRPDAIIYGAFDGDKIIAAGELRIILESWSASAEAAFSVEREYQDHGIGDALFHRLLIAAQNRNINMITIICLRENDKMRHLASKHSAKLNFLDGEVSGRLAPAWSSPTTFFEEAIGETNGMIKQFLNWSTKQLPSPANHKDDEAA